MTRKAIVSLIEMVVVVIILFGAFSVLFPGFSFQNRWEDAFISLKGRDVITTMDRVDNLLYSNSFDENSLRNFLDKTIPTNATNLIHWSGTDGTFKPKITVACVCTPSQIGNLTGTGRFKVNGRDIDLDIVSSGLNPIYSPSDVLIIWGYRDLTPFRTQILNYLNAENGVIELMDFQNLDEVTPVQNEIFGIAWDPSQDNINKGNKVADFVQFRGMPMLASNITYKPYKFFHNLTKRVATTTESDSIPGCNNPPPKGVFVMNNTAANDINANFTFWVCTGTSVWFDKNADNTPDILVNQGDIFKLGAYNFKLNYVDFSGIYISFKPNYKFADFLSGTVQNGRSNPPGKALGQNFYPQICPINSCPVTNTKRILANASFSSPAAELPAVILNETSNKRIAWMADIPERNTMISDDEKQLLFSLIAWAANKKYVSNLGSLKLGHLISYVNSINQDMYETYEFDLGLGFPF